MAVREFDDRNVIIILIAHEMIESKGCIAINQSLLVISTLNNIFLYITPQTGSIYCSATGGIS